MAGKYIQCTLHRLQFDDTKLIHVAYIPEQFAVLGKKLNIKMNEQWTDGWEVVEVGSELPEPPPTDWPYAILMDLRW